MNFKISKIKIELKKNVRKLFDSLIMSCFKKFSVTFIFRFECHDITGIKNQKCFFKHFSNK